MIFRVGGNPAGERWEIEHGVVAIIGVLDEDGPFIEREEIDEAVAVDLGDGRVHDHGALQAVWMA